MAQNVLTEVNIWIAQVALSLNYPNVVILKSDIPVEALSDLESDPEDIEGEQMLAICTARVGGVPVKWITQQKGWTSSSISRLLLSHSQRHLLIYLNHLVQSAEEPSKRNEQ